MKAIEALRELATTVGYLRSQPLAHNVEPSKELKRLNEACQALRGRVAVDREPNRSEVTSLAARCANAKFDLSGFSRRELRLLCWHDATLMHTRFRENLLEHVRSGEVRPNLSVLAKIYFGRWGEHENHRAFDLLVQRAAEGQPAYSAIYKLYKEHAAEIFGPQADKFLASEMLSADSEPTSTLQKWDVPPQSSLAARAIEEFLEQSLIRVERGTSEDLRAIVNVVQSAAVRLETLRKTAERLILCRHSDRAEEFRKKVETFVLDHPQLGDPRYQSNAPRWAGIDRKAEKIFRGWRNKVDLVFFFNSVMRDQGDRQGRKEFWLRYVNQAHESFVALCSTDAYRLRASLWREKIQYRKILDDQGVSCFVMRFRGHGEDIAIAEFSKVGSARIFGFKSFVEKIGSMDREEFALKDLRNDEGAFETFRHVAGWQLKVRNALASYGIRPS